MARPLRVEYPGALHHVTSRGNARAPIFVGDADRLLFLDVLGEVVDGHRWRCHAYCLMTNHYHLVVATPQANLSVGMRQLNGLYTQRFNRRHGRVGHVFQGRFKGILVERESHLLELARYVVLNPVRAGVVGAAEDYRWSSLPATLARAPAPSWLAFEDLLGHFASRHRYLEFVREGVGAASPWSALRGSVLGSGEFAERVGEQIGAKAAEREIPRHERLLRRDDDLSELFPPAVVENVELRDLRILEACRQRGYSLAEVARHLGLHYSTVSRIRRRDPKPLGRCPSPGADPSSHSRQGQLPLPGTP